MRDRERRLRRVTTRMTVRQRVAALLAAGPGNTAVSDDIGRGLTPAGWAAFRRDCARLDQLNATVRACLTRAESEIDMLQWIAYRRSTNTHLAILVEGLQDALDGWQPRHGRAEAADRYLDGAARQVGERVPEAVGMDARDARGPAETSEQLLEPVRPKAHASIEALVPGGDEERTRRRPPVGEIGSERVCAAPGEGHHAILAALAVADEQPALRQRAVREVQSDRFRTADARVQQREEDRAITAAHGRCRIAAGDQAGDLGGRQGRHDLAGHDPKRDGRRNPNYALVRQMAAEGLATVGPMGERRVLHPQRGLRDRQGKGWAR